MNRFSFPYSIYSVNCAPLKAPTGWLARAALSWPDGGGHNERILTPPFDVFPSEDDAAQAAAGYAKTWIDEHG